MFCSANSFVFFMTFLLNYLTILTTTVCGCGQLPSGQGRTLRFNIAGFSIPAVMAYTTDANVPSQVSSISRDEQAAKSFVQNLLMRSVEDVLEQEGRSAFLPDAVISAILQQLTINITYTPIKCNTVFTSAMPNGVAPVFVLAKKQNCYIINNIVRNICEKMANGDCDMPNDIKEVPAQHRTISGSFTVMWFTTTNVIMANWSTQMWQSILNRVMRSLSSGAFSTNFIGATVMIA